MFWQSFKNNKQNHIPPRWTLCQCLLKTPCSFAEMLLSYTEQKDSNPCSFLKAEKTRLGTSLNHQIVHIMKCFLKKLLFSNILNLGSPKFTSINIKGMIPTPTLFTHTALQIESNILTTHPRPSLKKRALRSYLPPFVLKRFFQIFSRLVLRPWHKSWLLILPPALYTTPLLFLVHRP